LFHDPNGGCEALHRPRRIVGEASRRPDDRKPSLRRLRPSERRGRLDGTASFRSQGWIATVARRAGFRGSSRDPVRWLAAHQASAQLAGQASRANGKAAMKRQLLSQDAAMVLAFTPRLSAARQRPDEHVLRTVGVAGRQVAGLRVEGDEPPSRRQRRVVAPPIALDPLRPEADPLGGA
jgi:hypothetical protein